MNSPEDRYTDEEVGMMLSSWAADYHYEMIPEYAYRLLLDKLARLKYIKYEDIENYVAKNKPMATP